VKEVRSARSEKWDFFVAPYGWLTGAEGTVVTDGDAVDVDIPFYDFLERTSAGFQLYFEARRNKVIVAFDGTWAILNDEIEGNLLDLDIEIRQRIYDIRVGYEILNREIGEVIQKPDFDWQRRGVVDVFAGGRYFRTEPILTFVPIIGQPRVVSDVDSRLDPFIGCRIGWDLSYRWAVLFRGDIGGFGIGSAARFSWQVTADLGYRVSRRVSILGGLSRPGLRHRLRPG
jgi:hypothetical protein